MSGPVQDSSLDHFGPDGMRRIPVPGAYRVRLPDGARRQLESVGVPLIVAPYFTAASPSDALTLGVFAGHHDLEPPPADMTDWLRIGTDRLAHLCVRPDGTVQAVFLDAVGEDDMLVSSSLAAFTAQLACLDRRLPVIAASRDLSVAAAAFRELNAELRLIDEAAFDARERWWPRVLDDVRHTLNFPFSSAFEYLDDAGSKQIVTDATGPGRAHPEELLWSRLEEQGIAPEQVRRVYCELQPCMMPGHYCAVWLQRTFPHAEFTHSFDYGPEAASREEGLKELITYAAQQARR
ncbi:nucleic acid/nucleotide deaminase domain-containing protein [Streptomyces sp. NBC_01445]|uniref:nucleic acid/nucleotide deaminase domain-containing protein n=1 Tax=Streptomyces sp. NBC_01445 TaxID=2903869 RepID=UPI002DD833ED|nr:nucleic acid/nucleotide deaminase domain-containing protein [Streptomyces sp. NBC_01445]WSE02078.1 SUKH-4 family immunity protein [Streptomyces sp. NBC_01445]WSE10252.1 SUKH-4 family immunity protein [Streptomyces sp. NBC_01445]WSE11179.1 SUKH-4 family immunity protein [Streptomyces sp. NBC_01445]